MSKKRNSELDKIAIFWAGLGILLILIFIFSFGRKTSADEVRMTIDFGSGQARNFVSAYRSGSRAWDLLQQANANYGLALEAEANFRPRIIGEFKNGEGGKRWNFYINGKKQIRSPFEVYLSGGEIILFKFE